MKKLLDEFKAFALKGNVIDMAIGVIIGGKFSAIVSSLVGDILTPVLSLLLGDVSLADLVYLCEKNGNVIEVHYGQFLQNIFDFIIVALCIFLFVKMINTAKAKLEKPEPVAEPEPEAEPELSAEAKLLTEIKELLENKD